MTCDKELRLVEKLADGEATPSERAEAEAHLKSCEDCRSHYELVQALEIASREIDLPEPPEAYWQHFPAKVTARIEREDRQNRRGFWGTLLAPSVLRWGAVAATLTLAVAVGVSVYRDDPGVLETEGFGIGEKAADSAEPKQEEDGVTSSGERAVPSEPQFAPAPATPRPSDTGATPRSREQAVPERSQEMRELSDLRARVAPEDGAEEEAPAEGEADPEALERLEDRSGRSRDELAKASRADDVAPAAEPLAEAAPPPPPASPQGSRQEAGEAGVAALASSPDRCEQWRRYLETDGDEGSQSREARYQVALCALREHEAAPSDETRRSAIRDAEAFLALEDDTDRAEAIRSRLERLRR